MKVLWITNSPLPAISLKMSKCPSPTGGWILSLLNLLSNNCNDITIAIATVFPCDKLIKETIDGIIYYCLPCKQYPTTYQSQLEEYWIKVKNEFKPDIVHIHGSEFTHGLSYIKACGNQNVILSTQGLVSIIQQFYLADIPPYTIRKFTTLRDIIKGGPIRDLNKLRKSALYEKEYILNLKHVIGRTTWDKVHVTSINESICYHLCNEPLRNAFYTSKWSLDKCVRHSIFISQAASPLKGLHKLIEALPHIIKKNPDTKVVVSGRNIYKKSTWINLHNTTYSSYITYLINKYELSNHIKFIGLCNEKEMVNQYLKANVFVCPSSIENSPNSLGEAQILGVPCVASYVGGIPDMITHGVSGFLYRFEDTQMLAEYICEIFSNEELSIKMSLTERIIASQRHNREQIIQNLIDIYKSIH